MRHPRAPVAPRGGKHHRGGKVQPKKPKPPVHPHPKPKPNPVIGQGGGTGHGVGGSGGPVPAPHHKRRTRGLGGNCVLEAVTAAGLIVPALDADELMIADVLELLTGGGQLAGFEPVDLDQDLSEPGLILGVELPGTHAVLVADDGWVSWGAVWAPVQFEDAVIEEAWRLG